VVLVSGQGKSPDDDAAVILGQILSSISLLRIAVVRYYAMYHKKGKQRKTKEKDLDDEAVSIPYKHCLSFLRMTESTPTLPYYYICIR
jgi:hypothetical protein